MLGVGVSLRHLRGTVAGFSPFTLFAGGEEGVWYDPSDLTTLFTDVAGTTPVTTPGDAIALMLDKSGNDYHATQSTAAARPKYGIVPETGRRNLLGYTSDPTIWAGAAYTENATSDPFGGNDGVLAECDVSGSGSRVTISNTLSLPEGETYTFSIWVKAGPSGVANFRLYFREQGDDFTIYGSGPAINSSDVWTRYEVSGVKEADGSVATIYLQNNEGSAADFYVFGPQLELGSTATAYQRVTTDLDVTEAGVPSLGYLSFDGVDDFMVTPTITPGTDKVQVFAGVRRMSAARGVLVGNFAADGYFEIQLNILSAENIEFASEGTLRRTGNFSLPAAPGSNIFTQLSDISGDSLVGRADGVQVVFSSGDQGTGNYLANPIYIGARDGVDLRFNGHIYSLITRFGPNLDAPVIGKTETYVAQKTGVQL